MRSRTPNAARIANCRARQRDRRIEMLIAQNQRLIEAFQAQAVELAAMRAEIAKLREMVSQQNQSPRQSELPIGPRARVEDITLSKSTIVRSKKKTPPIVLPAEFEAWWTGWPNKVGKKPAMAEYTRARRKVSAEVLTAGVESYVRNKPAEWQWCGPARWLKDERWDDHPAKQPTKQTPSNSRQYGGGGGYMGLFGS